MVFAGYTWKLYWIQGFRKLTVYGTKHPRINETPSINWALSNSLNTYNRHSDWHKLEVYATNDDWHKLKVYATNDEEIAAQVVMTIRNAYFAEFEKLLIRLQQLKAEGTL